MGDHGAMVDIDEDTQKALLLFNRRAEAQKEAAAAAKRLAKAERAKDEAAAAVQQAKGAEAGAEAEAAWREALQAWQDIRDGKEPEPEASDETDDEPEADEPEASDDEAPADEPEAADEEE